MAVERHERAILLGFLLFYAMIRIPMMLQSLWLDEGTSFWLAKAPLGELVRIHAQIRATHAVGYFFFLNLWCKVFGFSEISLRLPSLLMGIAGGYVTYLLAKKMKGISYALGVLLFYVISLTVIGFQTCARMYSFFYTFTIMGLYFIYSALEQADDRDKEKRYLILWGLVNGLNLNFHYFALFVMAAQMAIWIIMNIKDVKRIKRIFLYALIAALFAIPFAVLVLPKISLWKLFHPDVPSVTVAQEPKSNIMINLVYSIVFLFTGDHISGIHPAFFYVLFFAIILMCAFACKAMNKKDYGIIVMFLVLMFIALYAGDRLSFNTGYLFQYYYFAFMAPLFYMLILALLSKGPKALPYSVSIILIVVNLAGVYCYSTDPTIGSGNWRDAVRYIDAHLESDDVVFLDPTMAIPLYMFYSKNPSALKNDPDFYQRNIMALQSRYKRIWFLFLPGFSASNNLDMFYNRNLKVADCHINKNIRKQWYIVTILYTLDDAGKEPTQR